MIKLKPIVHFRKAHLLNEDIPARRRALVECVDHPSELVSNDPGTVALTSLVLDYSEDVRGEIDWFETEHSLYYRRQLCLI